MRGFQREVRSAPRTQLEIDAERFAESPAGRMIAEIEHYAAGRKSDVARNAETPGLASLMVEKYGYGIVKVAQLLGHRRLTPAYRCCRSLGGRNRSAAPKASAIPMGLPAGRLVGYRR